MGTPLCPACGRIARCGCPPARVVAAKRPDWLRNNLTVRDAAARPTVSSIPAARYRYIVIWGIHFSGVPTTCCASAERRLTCLAARPWRARLRRAGARNAHGELTPRRFSRFLSLCLPMARSRLRGASPSIASCTARPHWPSTTSWGYSTKVDTPDSDNAHAATGLFGFVGEVIASEDCPANHTMNTLAGGWVVGAY